MHRYPLTTSPTQLRGLSGAYLAGALLLWFYVEPGWFGCAALLLVGLLAWRDFAGLMRLRGCALRLDERGGVVALERRGQPYFYAKYKVYACRWFAILRLIDTEQPRTLILNFDSVTDPQRYRRLRRSLRALEASRAA